jgi:hypothetical protein
LQNRNLNLLDAIELFTSVDIRNRNIEEENTMSHIIRLFVLLLATPSVVTHVYSQTAEWKTNHGNPFVSEAPPAATPTPKLISRRKPTGMILSTGNLYFTTLDAGVATVWRTSQSSTPGQETALFREAGATFGDICFAKVDGAFFGYFFARNAGGLQIKRVSLTGGPATVLATIPDTVDLTNTHHNLITDGVNIYWQDDVAVRKIPIRGGPMTVIDPSSPNTPLAGIAFQRGNIIYASVREIRFVPPNGSSNPPSSRIIVTAPVRVITLHAVSNGVYWGDNNGAVKRKVGATTTTLQSNGSRFASSISSTGPSAGGTEAWTECSGSQCRLHLKIPFFVDRTLPVAGSPFGVTVKGRQVFWGDNAGVHRMAF